MSKLELYRTPSIVGASDEVQTVNIIMKKAEQYNNNMAMLQDYIGRAFNTTQEKINNLLVDKVGVEEEIRHLQSTMENAKEYIAVALTSVGVEDLNDKTSDICSSIKIKPAQEAYIEPRERSMTQAEMRELLLANGLPVKVIEDKEIEKKPATASISFRRGKKVSKITTKEAQTVLSSMQEVAYKDENNI